MSIRFDDLNDDLAVVDEFIRRGEKGLPDDRLYDGQLGGRRLVAACKRMRAMVQLYADITAAMMEDERARGADAMEPHSDPCRDD